MYCRKTAKSIETLLGKWVGWTQEMTVDGVPNPHGKEKLGEMG